MLGTGQRGRIAFERVPRLSYLGVGVGVGVGLGLGWAVGSGSGLRIVFGCKVDKNFLRALLVLVEQRAPLAPMNS